MPQTQRRYPVDELAGRGEEIFDRNIRPIVTAEDAGKFILIDVETGNYEIDADERAASRRLRQRVPDAQVWMRRVGSRSSYRFGRCMG